MRYVSLDNLEVSRIGLGAMGMSAYYTGAGSDENPSASQKLPPRRFVARTRSTR